MKIVQCGCLALVLGLSTSAHAERAWWKFWADTAETAVEVSGDRSFTPEQRRLLKDFLAGERERHRDRDEGHDQGKKPKKLPPGLQKKLQRGGELPPGWQKKMARGEVVDAQVWAQSHHLPADVLRRLGRQPAGTEIRYIDDQAYRVMRDTMEIIDILGL